MNTPNYEAIAQISQAFRPSSPIDSRLLFAGRREQMEKILDVVFQPGQHGIVYGSRGVGKTSLARVMMDVTQGEHSDSLLYTCNRDDTFDSIWRSVLDDIRFEYQSHPGTGFTASASVDSASALDLLGQIVTAPDGSRRALSPDDTRRALAATTSVTAKRVVIIDEFDAIRSSNVRESFADTIKALSDHGINATIILVGVADSLAELVQAHASIDRALIPIHMPMMSEAELAEIITRGMDFARLDVEEEFTTEVVRLAHGLPNYVHLIAQNAAKCAVEAERTTVLACDLDPAIERSVGQVDESVLTAYYRATTSNRETLYKDVLLACALARRDERDTFGATDVRDQLAAITGRFREIPAFAQHLKDFSGAGDRGGILERLGTQRKYRYRFVNPLLAPFVLMNGRASKEPGGRRGLPMGVDPSEHEQPPGQTRTDPES